MWMAQYIHIWRCRGPGGPHRLQNGWGVARRGPWWVRLPYASAIALSNPMCACHLTTGFCRICKPMLLFSYCKTMLPSSLQYMMYFQTRIWAIPHHALEKKMRTHWMALTKRSCHSGSSGGKPKKGKSEGSRKVVTSTMSTLDAEKSRVST